MDDTFAPVIYGKRKKHPVNTGDEIPIIDGSIRVIIKIQKRYPGYIVIYYNKSNPIRSYCLEMKKFCEEASI